MIMRYTAPVLFIFLVFSMLQPEAQAACRNPAVKRQFDRAQGYAHGRKGYVVDHVCSLFNHGIDDISNMQYQTIAEGKKKDRVENTPYGKKLYCNSKNSTANREVFNCK